MANLKISFPDLSYEAQLSQVGAYPPRDDMPGTNALTGERWTRVRRITAASQDGGPVFTILSGKPAAADHVIVARADLLHDNVNKIYVERQNGAGSFGTVVASDTSWGAADRKGPRLQDYILTFSLTTDTSAWRVRMQADERSHYMYSKIYLGKFFEMNVELDRYEIDRTLGDGEPFYSGDRTSHFARTSEPKYIGSLSWRGVTDAKVSELNAILADPDKWYCFLYTSSVHEVLDNVELLHVKITDYDYQRIHTDWNLVNLSYEELIG